METMSLLYHSDKNGLKHTTLPYTGAMIHATYHTGEQNKTKERLAIYSQLCLSFRSSIQPRCWSFVMRKSLRQNVNSCLCWSASKEQRSIMFYMVSADRDPFLFTPSPYNPHLTTSSHFNTKSR